jgi:hypothetical protein
MARFMANEATHCGHKLHPTASAQAGYCPVCKVKACLDFLDRIRGKWLKVGGPFKCTKALPAVYQEFQQAWRRARLELQTLISSYEAAARMEDAFHMKKGRRDEDYRTMTHSATAAMQLVHEGYKYPAPLTRPEQLLRKDTVMGGTEEAVRHKKTRKTVRWASDVQVNERRRSTQFGRGRQAYSAGRHALFPGHELEDTSFMNDLDYTRRQCRVFFAPLADMEAFEASKLVPVFGEIAALHAESEKIEAFMQKVLGRMVPEDQEHFLRKCAHAAGITLYLLKSGKIKYCRILKGRDVEEDLPDKVWPPSCRWVSMKDCQM